MKRRHLIKRYQNRKLYDTTQSKYVTLEELSELIKAGMDIKVTDNKTNEDLTTITLTQIIFEQEKKKKSLLPLESLMKIVQFGGERILHFVHDSLESGAQSFTQAREEAEKYMEKIKTPIDNANQVPSVKEELKRLQIKIEGLEKKFSQKK